jgi:hypothetical protein
LRKFEDGTGEQIEILVTVHLRNPFSLLTYFLGNKKLKYIMQLCGPLIYAVTICSSTLKRLMNSVFKTKREGNCVGLSGKFVKLHKESLIFDC